MAYMQPRRPITLGMQSLQIGRPPLPGQPGKPGQGGIIPLGMEQNAESSDLSAALSGIAEAMATDPINIESGTFSEGLAEGLERFMTTRAATQRAREEDADETREEKDEEARRRAIAEGVQAYTNGGDVNALVSALAEGAPEQALDLATVLMRQQAQQEPAEQWSEPYMLNGVLVQRNERTGQIRQAVSRAPQGQAGGGSFPDDGYDYE